MLRACQGPIKLGVPRNVWGISYFVTVSRKGHRRLHLVKGAQSGKSDALRPSASTLWKRASADSICKLCNPKISGAASSSSSGSEDSVAAAVS